MKWEQAHKLAQQLAALMRPHCERVEVAGSLRRFAEQVKDIELVCIPKLSERPREGTLLDFTDPVNVLWEALHQSQQIRWIKPGVAHIETWPLKPEGKYWRGLIAKGQFGAPAEIKLDLFLTRRANWGVIFAIRTGSADFSRELVTFARDHTDYRVEDGELKLQGGTVPCPDERVLFDALGLRWIDPIDRKGKSEIVRKNA